MKQFYNIAFTLLFLPVLVFGHNGKGKYTEKKTIEKEYTVNPDAGLKVNNSYGNIDIATWNENRTVIVVTIITNGDNEEKVKERLKEIDVEFSGNSSLVSATTRFGHKKKSWNSWWGSNNKNVHIEVNYTIKLPVTNTVDLNNDYGTINIDKLEGKARINCDYGQLIIGDLMADDNYLNFDYTNKSSIGYMKSGKISADYSGFTLDKAENVELNADYTKSEIVEAGDVNYNCDYGKVEIGQVTNLYGRGDYVTNRIGTVNGNLNLNTDYGSIRVDRLSSTAKDVTITADYTGVKIGYDANYHFDFVINLRYAGLNGDEDFNVRHSSKEGSGKRYSGYHGTEGSGNNVSINSDYGGVTFIKY